MAIFLSVPVNYIEKRDDTAKSLRLTQRKGQHRSGNFTT